MPRGSSSPCILRSMSGLAGCFLIPVPSSMTFTSSASVSARKHHAHRELLVEPVAVLDGVDAGLGHRRLQILDAVLAEAHQLGHRGRRAHGHLLVAQARGQPDFHGGGFRLAHAGISVTAPRHSASAVMSSPCGPPSANSSMAAHNASRISSAFCAGHAENSFKSLSGPNSSSPLKTSVSPSV